MPFFESLTDFLTGPVGNNLDNAPEDISTTKTNLNALGYFDDDTDNGYITRELDTGIKNFQKDNDMKVDGVLRPGGETERAIYEAVTQRPSDDAFGPDPMKQEGTGIGFGTGISTLGELQEAAYQQTQSKSEVPEKTEKPRSLFSLLEEEEEDTSPVQYDATGRMMRDKMVASMAPKKDLILVNSEKLTPKINLTKAPIENDGKKREKILLDNTPAKFEIRDNPNLNSNSTREKAINSLIKDDNLARKTVNEHKASIGKFSGKHGVDPDLVRAIMWAENARGDKLGLNRVADLVGVSGSQRPFNINGEKWGQLVNKPGEKLNNSDENIEAGVIPIKRIQNRIEEPTASKIGSIWNYAGKENTSDFGAAIGEIYKAKPWKKKK